MVGNLLQPANGPHLRVDWLDNFSGLYYKHVMIVNYASSSVTKLKASLNDNARVVIYDCHMFIVQDTGAVTVFFLCPLKIRNLVMLNL